MRLNDWTSIVVFIGAVTYFVVSARLHPGREVIHRGEDTGPASEPPESPSDEEVSA